MQKFSGGAGDDDVGFGAAAVSMWGVGRRTKAVAVQAPAVSAATFRVPAASGQSATNSMLTGPVVVVLGGLLGELVGGDVEEPFESLHVKA